MNKKFEKWARYIYFLMAFVMLWQNVTFFFNHMSDDDSNLGIALGGIPLTLIFLCIAINHSLYKNRRARGLVYAIGMPLIALLELMIYFLQDYPLRFGFVISLLLYFALFVIGCVDVRKASRGY